MNTYADCFPDPLPEIPDSCPVSVDSALHALTTLQLGAAHAAIGAPGMRPKPATLYVIEVRDIRARERVGSLVRAMLDEGAASGLAEPKVIEQIGTGKSVDAEMFHGRIEKALLSGTGVIAILTQHSELRTGSGARLRRP